MRYFWMLILLLSISACAPNYYAPPPEVPESIAVIYTPAIGWIRNNLHACAATHPKIALTLEERPLTSLDVEAAEVILKLGPAPEQIARHATLLGWEQIMIISDPNIPSGQLELPDLRLLFASMEPEYQLWSYPSDSELSNIFDQFVLLGKPSSPHVLIAPDPQAMLMVIRDQPNSVGYIPQTWLRENTALNTIVDSYPDEFKQPILALTNGEPFGLTRELLACIQSTLP